MIEYNKISECNSFASWLYYEWDYICALTQQREKGFRIFGLVFRNGGHVCGKK